MNYLKERMLEVLNYLRLIDIETEVYNHKVEQSVENDDGKYDNGDFLEYSFDVGDYEFFVEEQSMSKEDWVTYPTKKVYHLREKNSDDFDYKVTFEVNGHSDEYYEDKLKKLFGNKEVLDADGEERRRKLREANAKFMKEKYGIDMDKKED